SESDPGTALQMANRLTCFWTIRGYFTEGRRRLADLRQHATGGEPHFTDALIGEAWLATDQGDRGVALPLLGQALVAARATGDRGREADALLARGRVRGVIGDPAGAREDVEEALAIREGSGDAVGLAVGLWLGGAMAHFAGELQLAQDRLEACAQGCAQLGQPVISARAGNLLGAVRMDMGNLSGAEAALADAVPAVVELDDRFGIPVGLTILAGLAAQRRRPRTALRLAGAAAAHEQADQTNRPQFIRTLLQGWLAPVLAEVGPAASRVQAEGRAMGISELLAAGIDPRPEDPWHVGTSPGLTEREGEIAILAAQGLTNRQIAEHLVLSVRTVETHVSRVLTKLGFSTRGQLTVWAHQEGLMTDLRGEVT
ncbi:helix-turn-helix transcriptional regulator, partial [Terrabacter terrae]|uniref:helix-turn-helix transcriptional regulator n=1 Tax=Terrabacter terrae TaxID=318434 RepID=UPI0031DCE7E7